MVIEECDYFYLFIKEFYRMVEVDGYQNKETGRLM